MKTSLSVLGDNFPSGAVKEYKENEIVNQKETRLCEAERARGGFRED